MNNGSYIESTGTGTLIIDGNDDEISADSTSYIKIANLLLKNGFTTTLTNSNNDIKTLAATGMTSLTYSDSNDITIGTVNGVTGITASGDVNLYSASDIFVYAPISNGSNVLKLNATGDVYYISDKSENNEPKNTDNSYLINANSYYTIKDFQKFDNINNKSISSADNLVDLPNIKENSISTQLSSLNEILGKNTTEKNINPSNPIIKSSENLTKQSTNSSKQSESSSKNEKEQKRNSIEQNTNFSSIVENSNENSEEQETDSSASSENSSEETTDSTSTSESSNHDSTEEDTIHLGEAQIEIDVDENGKIVYSKSQIEVKVKNNGKLIFSNNSKDILETVGLSIKDGSLVNDKIEIVLIDKKTTSKYSATLLDGSSLPEYLIFNPKTGKIDGVLPKDIRKLGLNIKAMDKDKTIRILSLKIKF